MKIGIDARVMSLEASGIGRYSIEMVSALATLPETLEHQFILFPGSQTIRLDLPDNWSYFSGALPQQGAIRALRYPKIAEQLKLDRFYTMDYLGPICTMPCKSVITIHDLIPIVRPELTTLKHRIIGRLLLPRTIKKSTTIISVSQSTKTDIFKQFNTPPDKVEVVYNGISQSFLKKNSPGEDQEFLENYKIGDKSYILFLSTLEPKKNLKALIKAYSVLNESHRTSYNLVLGGNLGWDNEELNKLIVDYGLEDNVIFTGFVQEDHLPLLFTNATAFCFPSLYEGFGLPIIEAMACGCPVITSNISSMPEIAGNAALLVDPNNLNDIVQAIAMILENKNLRNDLKEKSLQRSKEFSWVESSKRVLQIITSP